ncbi:hypothetical protein D1R32_gp026 [Tunisvirus fontaine2]|uniref:Uncharacterized protein n=1 Tax=Tunisvirus fontaine2 TaxID=1421067 RepID=V9SD04_9VIRU|nr:hypothetical protein D1R32_gp026 [Tunisvirus fontaine2]AHC54743.1 hypothetical protein TNS_ORF25 [Tunisvirus fontaine2]
METFYLSVVQDDPSSHRPTPEPLSGKLWRTYSEAIQELESFHKDEYGLDELPCENSGTWGIWTLKLSSSSSGVSKE